MQQEAVRNLGMTTDRTMYRAAVYEGIDVGGGITGLITYMRTDLVALANEAVVETATISAAISTLIICPQHRSPTKQIEERAGSARGDPPHIDHATPEAVKAYLSPEQFKL